MQHERYSEAKKVTLIGALINALLGFIKLIGGVLFHSHALIADGVHSFSDLITDVMVLFASKYGSQAVDDSHPYGHQRIETAATLFLSLVLIMAGTGIAWDSITEISNKSHTMPGWLSLPIAVLSILANEGLFHYTQRVGQRIKSDLIIANAWHHRSDAASSIVVLIGLLGSLAGFIYLDALAAVIVGLMIIQMGWSYGWNSVKELVDTAVDPDIIANIEKLILQVGGVTKIHQLRSRSMGRDIFLDVHILVEPHISVSEGHFIAQHVHVALMKALEQVKDVTVHVDPEDDETSCPSLHLPSRKALEKQILLPWQKEYPAIQSWVLHYLDGKLTIDVICDQTFDAWPTLHKRIQKDLDQPLQIDLVRVYTQQAEIQMPSEA
jgi:cation diffusion facilitator family transporter